MTDEEIMKYLRRQIAVLLRKGVALMKLLDALTAEKSERVNTIVDLIRGHYDAVNSLSTTYAEIYGETQSLTAYSKLDKFVHTHF